MVQLVYFSSPADCVQFVWWLRTFLPKPNPLKKDAEFYAFVTYLINISFHTNAKKPWRYFTIDYFLHAAVLLAQYLSVSKRGKRLELRHAFAHYLMLVNDLHNDFPLVTAGYGVFFTKPTPIIPSDTARDFYFAAIHYNAGLLTTDFASLRQAWCAEAPPEPYTYQAYRTQLTADTQLLAKQPTLPFPKYLTKADKKLFKQISGRRSVYFASRADCVQFAWWLRNFLPKPNPLEKDREFYAFVTYLINIRFPKNSGIPLSHFPIDYFLHTAMLLAQYMSVPHRRKDLDLRHAFTHYLMLSDSLHNDFSLRLSDYSIFFTQPVPITLSNAAKSFYFAALDYHTDILTTDFAQLRQEWCDEWPPEPYTYRAYQAWLKTDNKAISTYPALPFPKNLSTADTKLFNKFAATSRCSPLRLGLWCLLVVASLSAASIVVGVLLSQMLPVVIGTIALCSMTSVMLSCIVPDSCQVLAGLFSSGAAKTKPQLAGLHPPIFQADFLR